MSAAVTSSVRPLARVQLGATRGDGEDHVPHRANSSVVTCEAPDTWTTCRCYNCDVVGSLPPRVAREASHKLTGLRLRSSAKTRLATRSPVT